LPWASGGGGGHIDSPMHGVLVEMGAVGVLARVLCVTVVLAVDGLVEL